MKNPIWTRVILIACFLASLVFQFGIVVFGFNAYAGDDTNLQLLSVVGYLVSTGCIGLTTSLMLCNLFPIKTPSSLALISARY